YAAMWDNHREPWALRSGGPGSGIWRSTDGGENWERLTDDLPDGMGKIGVLVAMTGGDAGFGRQVAMHVAAADPRPQALNEAELDPAIVEKEKHVQMDIARESGKPEAVIEKMIMGRMKKFLAEITLLNQSFVVDPDKTVGQAAADAGATITGFVRFEVGEGIEVEKEDFAAEVAKAAQG
ncbi:MAG: translation elongation factor Ts, partial [Pseudomonadota bacterium]